MLYHLPRACCHRHPPCARAAGGRPSPRSPPAFTASLPSAHRTSIVWHLVLAVGPLALVCMSHLGLWGAATRPGRAGRGCSSPLSWGEALCLWPQSKLPSLWQGCLAEPAWPLCACAQVRVRPCVRVPVCVRVPASLRVCMCASQSVPCQCVCRRCGGLVYRILLMQEPELLFYALL